MIEKRFEQIKTVHQIAPVFLKDEGRIEALFTLYAIALLVQALIERELRQAMAHEAIVRNCPLPRRMATADLHHRAGAAPFSLAERHQLRQHGRTVFRYLPYTTDLQRKSARAAGVPASTF